MAATQLIHHKQSVPFQNVVLNQGATLISGYSFGPYSVIFCYTNGSQTTGNIVWPYHGKRKNGSLPISLVTNGNFQGEFADPNGTIIIQNTAGTPVVVSCQYGF
jgi:hypothetical protein